MELKNLKDYGIPRDGSADDELAIRRVIAANEQAITDNDPESYVAAFAADATVEYWDKTVYGADEIREYFLQQQNKATLRDVAVNLLIEIDGETATATGSGFSLKSDKPPVQILATANVVTKLKKVANGAWRIVWQAKVADKSFDIKVGTLGDVVERLTQRIERLENSAGNFSGSHKSAAVDPEPVEQRLVALETKLREAVLASDRQQILDLLDDDFTGIGFAGQIVNKDLYAEVHTNPQDPFTKFEVDHSKIIVFGNAALIQGVQNVTAAIQLRSRYVCAFSKRGDAWKIVYWQETAIVDPDLFKEIN